MDKAVVQAELQSIGRGIAAILQENFIGLYITGSITMGAWNLQKSDLDFLVVMKHPGDDRTQLGCCRSEQPANCGFVRSCLDLFS